MSCPLGFLAEVITASDVRATCGGQGVAVHWGFVGWPRARYALDDIQDARVVESPWYSVSYGFWWTPWRTVCTVRRGPALRLRLLSGRTVTITVPDPHAAVAALRSTVSTWASGCGVMPERLGLGLFVMDEVLAVDGALSGRLPHDAGEF